MSEKVKKPVAKKPTPYSVRTFSFSRGGDQALVELHKALSKYAVRQGMSKPFLNDVIEFALKRAQKMDQKRLISAYFKL